MFPTAEQKVNKKTCDELDVGCRGVYWQSGEETGDSVVLVATSVVSRQPCAEGNGVGGTKGSMRAVHAVRPASCTRDW